MYDLCTYVVKKNLSIKLCPTYVPMWLKNNLPIKHMSDLCIYVVKIILKINKKPTFLLNFIGAISYKRNHNG
jgi:hypothetical protein